MTMNNKHAKHGFLSAFFGAVLALSAFTVAQEALAQAATVTFASGNVSIVGANGASRAARRGSEVNAGETVNTAAASWAQLKFSDGAMTSLQPETGFKIDEYQFKGAADGSERGFFSLLKGAMRTVTGAIGHGAQRDNYRVKTATATVGIRGTEYLMRLGNGLFVSVGNGRVALFNDAGELILGPGQTGFVRDAKTFPQLVMQKPLVGAPQLREEIRFVAAEQRTGEAGSTALGDDHHSGGGGGGGSGIGLGVFSAGLMTAAGQTDLAAGADHPSNAPGIFALVASGDTLQSFQYHTFVGNIGSANAVETGSKGGVSYGRWTSPGATATGFNIGATSDPHVTYVFGIQSALPTTGSMTLLPAGGTNPVNAGGTTGAFTSGNFTLDFTNSTYNFALAFGVGGANYIMTSGAQTLYGDSRFSGTTTTGVCTGAGCGATSGLATNWSGMIVNSGNTVGLNYAIKDPSSTNKAVSGAQVFTPGGI